MAHKKKTTKQNKKQKQKQRQYQKQSVVVNVHTATKRKTSRASGGKKVSVSQPLIQSLPFQYTPQLMVDQSSLLSDDSRNRIFQSEIKHGISLLNKQVETQSGNIASSLAEIDKIKRDTLLEKKLKDLQDEDKEKKRMIEKEKRERRKRDLTNARGGMGTEGDTENELSIIKERLKTKTTPMQRDIMRDIQSRNPLPTPRDNSINLSNTKGNDTADEEKIDIVETPIRMRTISRKHKPILPSPIDNSINMNNSMMPVEPDNVEEAVVAEKPQRTTARSKLDEEFTEQPNGRWICNTCVHASSIAKSSRATHLKTPMHKNGGRQPAFRSP